MGTITPDSQIPAAEIRVSYLDIRTSEILARVAHEMRQPLAAVVSAVSTIRHITVDERRLHACDVIERQSSRLARLVEDLLVISRAGLDITTLQRQDVELGRLVLNVIDGVRPLILKKEQHLDITLPSELCWIHADVTRLEQVFSNLLVNATNYTDSGGRLWVDVVVADRHASVTIGDTGCGITPDLLPHVFEMFTTGRVSAGRGLGVGLAVARQLVELHRGTIRVSSAGKNRGSVVVVTLPVSRHKAGVGH